MFGRNKRYQPQPTEQQPGEKPDPTGNVLQLVQAAIERQDDLRAAESRRVNELMELRSKHYTDLREAEAKRIDAIRAVDVQALAVASQRADATAQTLATQVAATAENLRSLVASTAAAHAAALSQITTAFTDRLALLEKAQYEGSGKQAVTDPMLLTIVQELKGLRESDQTRKGSSGGMEKLVLLAIAVIMAIIALVPFLSKQ